LFALPARYYRAVAGRATKDVLLRLRKAKELELRRELVVRRAERTAARRAVSSAEAARRALEERMRASRQARTDGWAAPRRAGRVAQAARFEDELEASLRRARLEERKAAAALDRAESALKAVQHALGEAVHARQRSETLARAVHAAGTRARERREHAEVEDRWRPPKR